VIELPIAMLACVRIGAVHTVVFAGFSSDSLAARILQTKSKVLITADGSYRGNKAIHLKALADQAVEICRVEGHRLDSVVVVEHLKRITVPNGAATIAKISYNKNIDCVWETEMANVSGVESPVEWCEAEHPSFILYTS